MFLINIFKKRSIIPSNLHLIPLDLWNIIIGYLNIIDCYSLLLLNNNIHQNIKKLDLFNFKKKFNNLLIQNNVNLDDFYEYIGKNSVLIGGFIEKALYPSMEFCSQYPIIFKLNRSCIKKKTNKFNFTGFTSFPEACDRYKKGNYDVYTTILNVRNKYINSTANYVYIDGETRFEIINVNYYCYCKEQECKKCRNELISYLTNNKNYFFDGNKIHINYKKINTFDQAIPDINIPIINTKIYSSKIYLNVRNGKFKDQ